MIKKYSMATFIVALIVFALEVVFTILAVTMTDNLWIFIGLAIAVHSLSVMWGLLILYIFFKYTDSETYGITAACAMLCPLASPISMYFSYRLNTESKKGE